MKRVGDVTKKHLLVFLTLSIVTLFASSLLLISSTPPANTITVNNEVWVMQDGIASRTLRTGEVWASEGTILHWYVLFPAEHQARNYTIEIDIEAVEGEFDLLIFPGLEEFQDYRFVSVIEGADYLYINSTSVKEEFATQRTVVIGIVGHTGDLWITGSIIASCVLTG